MHHRRSPLLTEALRPLSILLAEDDDDMREVLARCLEADGALVECVADGEAARSRLFEERLRPDVVLSDVRMPGTSGVELLAIVRSAGLTTPVILISGFGQTVDRDRVEALGGAVLLEKPFDIDDLRTALLNLRSIGVHPARRESGPSSDSSPPVRDTDRRV